MQLNLCNLFEQRRGRQLLQKMDSLKLLLLAVLKLRDQAYIYIFWKVVKWEKSARLCLSERKKKIISHTQIYKPYKWLNYSKWVLKELLYTAVLFSPTPHNQFATSIHVKYILLDLLCHTLLIDWHCSSNIGFYGHQYIFLSQRMEC